MTLNGQTRQTRHGFTLNRTAFRSETVGASGCQSPNVQRRRGLPQSRISDERERQGKGGGTWPTKVNEDHFWDSIWTCSSDAATGRLAMNLWRRHRCNYGMPLGASLPESVALILLYPNVVKTRRLSAL